MTADGLGIARTPHRSGARPIWIPIGALLAIAAAILLRPWGTEGDVERFVALATASARPYRDVPTEFAPLETLAIRVLFETDVATAATRVSILSTGCYIAICAVLWKRWGSGATGTYALISLPLQVFMPFRIDHLPTLFAVVAAAFATRAPTASGVSLAVGTGFKIWPIAIAPIVLARSRRAWIAFSIVVVAVGAGWLAVGGTSGIEQVGTFRGADGWHVESTVGIVTWLATPDDHRVEGGAVRVGRVEGWNFVVLAAASIGATIIAARRARRTSMDPAGIPSLVAVSTLLVLAPIASPQYLAWLAPWIAVTAGEFRSKVLVALALVAGLSASASFLVYWDVYGGAAHLMFTSLVRVVCVIGIGTIAWERLLRERPAPQDARA